MQAAQIDKLADSDDDDDEDMDVDGDSSSDGSKIIKWTKND